MLVLFFSGNACSFSLSLSLSLFYLDLGVSGLSWRYGRLLGFFFFGLLLCCWHVYNVHINVIKSNTSCILSVPQASNNNNKKQSRKQTTITTNFNTKLHRTDCYGTGKVTKPCNTMRTKIDNVLIEGELE